MLASSLYFGVRKRPTWLHLVRGVYGIETPSIGGVNYYNLSKYYYKLSEILENEATHQTEPSEIQFRFSIDCYAVL